MARSNSRNGGSTYFDLDIQTVSADGDTYVLRAVVYLTSLNVIDANNALDVGGNWSRGGSLPLSGVYNHSPVWYQDIAVSRVVGVNVGVSVSATWSSVEYWGGALSASEGYTVPAKVLPPDAPSVGVTNITSTSAAVYTTAAGAENGATADAVNYRIHRVSDGAHMGDLQGGYGGVTYYNLSRATTYDAYGQTHNAAGWGAFSGPARFTTPATVPGAPGTPVASGITPTSVNLSWTAPDDGGSAITGYGVQRASDPGFTVGVATFSSPTPSYVMGSLTPGGGYWIRVRAGNGVGTGPWSAAILVTTLTGMRVYNGAAWVNAPVYAWNGSSWVVCEVRIYNGSAWVPTG